MAAEPMQHTELIGLMGDQDSVVGFLLGGIGQKIVNQTTHEHETNVHIIENETPTEEIEDAFRHLLSRTDIGVILITRLVADRIRYLLELRKAVYPIILEIPAPVDPFEMGNKADAEQCRKIKVQKRRKNE